MADGLAPTTRPVRSPTAETTRSDRSSTATTPRGERHAPLPSNSMTDGPDSSDGSRRHHRGWSRRRPDTDVPTGPSIDVPAALQAELARPSPRHVDDRHPARRDHRAAGAAQGHRAVHRADRTRHRLPQARPGDAVRIDARLGDRRTAWRRRGLTTGVPVLAACDGSAPSQRPDRCRGWSVQRRSERRHATPPTASPTGCPSRVAPT